MLSPVAVCCGVCCGRQRGIEISCQTDQITKFHFDFHRCCFFLMKISHQNPLTLCLYPESARKLQHLQEQGHSSLTPPCV